MREKAKPFNVKVAVRVRPILAHDRDPRPVVRVDRESAKPSVTVVDPDKEFPGLKQNIDYLRVDYIRERSYEFDYVWSDAADRHGVPGGRGAPSWDCARRAKQPIFAYGQTGSGKTIPDARPSGRFRRDPDGAGQDCSTSRRSTPGHRVLRRVV